MLYNLPTGKTIQLSVEQYLDMTDEEFEYLISINYGDNIQDPFYKSMIKEKPSAYKKDDDDDLKICDQIIEELDESIDYTSEEE
jgi:hypothetical protein